MLSVGVAIAGAFTLALGVMHLAIPWLIDARTAVGVDGSDAPLHRLAIGHLGYRVRRRDVLGLTWVMSNAASYVLITIGLVDLSWLAGWRGAPLVAATWIAGWWAIRAGGQFVLGNRPGDVAVAVWFTMLALIHVGVALGLAPP